jgi:signal transduction histidine kinase
MVLKNLLGEILINKGLVSRQKIEQALEVQKKQRDENILPEHLSRTSLVSETRIAAAAQINSQLGSLLLEMGLVTQKQLDLALAEQSEAIYALARLSGNKLATLMEIGSIVNSTLNLSEVLQLIMNFSNRVTNSTASTLMLLDKETDELVFSVPTGPKVNQLTDIRMPSGQGVAGWVAKNQKPLTISDPRNDPRFYGQIDQQTGFTTKSILAVPLRAKGKLIGVLEVINKQGDGGFTKEDEAFLSMFGAQAAMAIENARLYNEMKIKMDKELEIQQKMAESEKLRALGLMASGIYHNFNNLLTVILGNAELIENSGESKATLEKVSTIKRAALDGADVVNRVLSFTRSHEGMGLTHPVYLNQLIEEAVRMTEPVWKGQAQSQGIDIEVTTCLEENEVTIPGNESALKEVLVNLLFNAVDAMPQGGGIKLGSYMDGDQACITVKDTGVGMSPETQKRIFDPFYSTKGMGHSGLGMSSAYGIIKNHKGTLRIESRPGKGSEFIISLPCKLVEDAGQSVKPKPAGKKSLRILLVDDEEKIGRFVKEALMQSGHQVTYFSQAQTGLAELENSEFDLLLTDLVMPQMSGWEVIELARAMQPELNVGVMTGWEVSDAERQERKVDFIIRKPFQITDLLETIAAVQV